MLDDINSAADDKSGNFNRRGKRDHHVDLSKIDRLPPHSLEAEQGVLGCVILSPAECLNICLSRFGSVSDPFYDLRHQLLYEVLLRMHQHQEPIDLLTIQQRLKDSHQLETVGGLAYLASLPEAVPSAANLEYYIGIVREKSLLRRMIQTCSQVISSVYQSETDPFAHLERAEFEFQKIRASQPEEEQQHATVEELLNFDTQNDPDVILGNRWLCKGGALVINGPSGVGKSSLQMQFAAFWALNYPCFGIKPHKPLKSLIIQAENDKGDLAEMLQGVTEGMGITKEEHPYDIEKLKKNLIFRTDSTRTGPTLVAWVKRLVFELKPDLVWIDPAAAFVGDDLGRQTVIAEFFRNGLNPIAKATGCIFIIINHTTKPPNDPKARRLKGSESQYGGAGSYDLPGWARAVMMLRQVGDTPNFELKLAKRDTRAGATNPDGSPTTSIWLQHATTGILWVQQAPPEEPADQSDQRPGGKPSIVNRVSGSNLYSFCVACTTEGEGMNTLAKRLENWLSKELKEDVSLRTCKNIIPALVANGKLEKRDGLYFKGKNA